MTAYCPLWVKSNFSFLEGASHPDELVSSARELGLSGLALTDRDGVYGVVSAHLKAREVGLPLVIGAQVSVSDDGDDFVIVLLAQDRAGYANLCRLLTKGRLRSTKGSSTVPWDEVCAHAAGLIALTGGANSPLTRAAEPRAALDDLKDAFSDRLYALLVRHRSAGEVRGEERLRHRAARLALPLVAANEVLYHAPDRRPLQDVVTCIRHKTRLSSAGRLLRPNANHALFSPIAFEQLFADERSAIARTLEVRERCSFALDQLRYRYPSERLPDGTTTALHLRNLTLEGARGRYGGTIPADVLAQLDRELALIEELDYGGYFLTMHEIVVYCREHGILCQGRGSAANSAVCYCLGITAIDPVRMKLLFERFLSRERHEPPDIDLDIEHERREEVIQQVYAKYGRDKAAMVANVIRYRPRSAIRDVGKALGFEEIQLDRIAKVLSHWGDVDRKALATVGIDLDQPENAPASHLIRLANEILDTPRHLSIHPGGFLLGHEPVHDIVPIENASMDARTVIQWDKDDLENMNLFKVDLLALGSLTQLHRAFDLLKRHKDKDLSMATIPADDAATFDQIGKGDTLGVFQIESRAQMAMLPRLRPRNFYDVVIEVSIVRPGPISGGMVHPYLRRRRGEEKVIYPHPSLEPVLERTLGVPLFQEQVMKLAIVAADYTPGEADQLRRDMAAWRKTGRIEQHHHRLVSRMSSKGIAPEFAERVFEQIRGFGEYGFPECVAGATHVIDADTGASVRIDDVAAGRVPLRRTLTCSRELRIEPRRVIAAKKSGPRPVFRMRTALGHEIEATANHPFLTRSGWTSLGELRTGDAVATARLATSDADWDRIISIDPAGQQETFDLSIDGNHNFLANDFVVHNSHAASFALIAYAAAWLRCHEPDVFTCALLNAQPMGFYSVATIVQDAQRHGVVIAPVDALASEWDATLEPIQSIDASQRLAVRMGLRFVKGLARADADRLIERRRPVASLDQLVRAVDIGEGAWSRLAEAGALERLEPAGSDAAGRRRALWSVAGRAQERDHTLGLVAEEIVPSFPPLQPAEEIAWDYRATDHSPRGHLLKPLRQALRRLRLLDASAVSAARDGARVRYAGIVICRQRPGTAKGVVFLTLEDESGFVNLVCWESVFERQALLIKTASFLGVEGRVQKQDGVVHVIAERFFAPDLARATAERGLARLPEVRSHDFH